MDESNMQAERKETVGDNALQGEVALGKPGAPDNPPCLDNNLVRSLLGATHLWCIAVEHARSNPLGRAAEVIGSILTAENLYSIPTAGNPVENGPIGHHS